MNGDGVQVWLGVPFAAPPGWISREIYSHKHSRNPSCNTFNSFPIKSQSVGELRFKPAVAPSTWSAPLSCTTVPALCPQSHVTKKYFQGSEGWVV